jgi:catechol 2,3-dioxygenase-like lactoylglutathione lyase family enzyme
VVVAAFDRLGLGIHGLDHVRVLVRDLEAAKDRYRNVLGFRVPPRGDNYRHPLGSYQTVTRFGDAFYLELLAVHDRVKMSAGRPEMVQFLDRHEGGHSVLLNVRSARAAADLLRGRGLAALGPTAGGFEPSNDDGPLSQPWWLVNFSAAPFTKEAFSLIEYEPDWPAQQRHAAGWIDQPNGVNGVRAVWLAVADLSSAATHFAALGLERQHAFGLDHLDADACEVQVAEGQNIWLLQPRGERGPVGVFLAARGQAGVMGVTLQTRERRVQAQRLASTIGTDARSVAGRYGSSVMVPGAHACGLWLEFVDGQD